MQEMKNGFADFRQLPKAKWHEVNKDYFVINGESCYGVVRLTSPNYLASIVGRVRGVMGGDLGRFASVKEAQKEIEQWLLERGQIGMETVATEDGLRSSIVPLKPMFFTSQPQCS